MLIRLGYEIIFHCPEPVAMTLLLRVHPSREQSICKQSFGVEPEVEPAQWTDQFGNRCERLLAPRGKLRLWADAVVEDSGLPDIARPEAGQWPVEHLPPEVLPFLLNSRYCEVDKLTDMAWDLFGRSAPGWARVQAICDWVHAKVQFGYGYARPTKSALDVLVEGTGVCRDFTHLAITFCRCMNIPARYATGYLGDIGVPVSPSPMDFSAWFEVFLDGQWFVFDARHNAARIGRVLMARGRDATDVALTTSFGSARLDGFKVWTDEVKEPCPN